MSVYKLQKPFMTRKGQFEEGKSTLVVGILESVLLNGKDSDVMKLFMGNSKTEYRQTYQNLKAAEHTIWNNRDGKRVRIVPVKYFEVKLPKSEVSTQKKLF